MTIGTKVRVRPLGCEWNKGAAETLSGMVGEIKQTHPTTGLMLVQFDERPKAWHANQIPSECWWFEPHEIEAVS